MFTRIQPIVLKLLVIISSLFTFQYLSEVDLTSIIGLHCILSSKFATYQYITHILLHVTFLHLLSNAIAIISFGNVLEQTFGSKNFLIFLMFTGLGSALLSSMIQYFDVSNLSKFYQNYLINTTPSNFEVYLSYFPSKVYETLYEFSREFFKNPNNNEYVQSSKIIAHKLLLARSDTPILGSSGIVFGMLAAFALLFPDTELLLLFLPIPIKAKYLISIYAMYEIYLIMNDSNYNNISNFAHLGGAIFGYVFTKFWERQQEG